MKFQVTPELAKTLKVVRVQRGISSKEVADHLGKSPSYVSKLEGGDVKYIGAEALTGLLCFLAGSEDFYGEVLPAVASALEGVVGSKVTDDQLWFIHYDVAVRPVEVPAGMTAELAAAYDELGVTPAAIAAHLNANIDSGMPDSFPANELLTLDSDGKQRLLARVEVTEDEVRGVVYETGHVTTYFFLYNVVHTMHRMRLYPGAAEKLPSDDAARLLRLTADYLGRWGVHSLMGFSHFISSEAFVARQAPMVGTEGGVIDELAGQLREVMAHDSLRTASQLGQFRETLAWDPAFALKLVGIPFSALGTLSHTNKQRLLEDVEALVERYDQLDEFAKRAEEY